MTDQKKTGMRFILAAAAGFAVAFIATLVAWQSIAPMHNVRYDQWFTQRSIEDINRAIPAYQQLTNSLPQKLDDLHVLQQTYWLRFDKNQRLVDGWDRPFAYSTDGTNYTVTSFGRDGKPGGIGLDCDITSADPYSRDAVPSFSQFLADCPTHGIVNTCIVTGMLTFALCWFLAKPPQLSREKLLLLAVKILVTIVGSIIVATILSVFHIPTGH